MADEKTGTREWAQHSANCCLGCSHGCLYCYARADALRWKRIASADEWTRERRLPLPKSLRRRDGVVMFPTTHDITPGNLDHCLAMLAGFLKAGTRVLVVSKPHVECVRAICAMVDDVWYEAAETAATVRSRLEFRFTIGALSSEVLAFWEPGAPDSAERRAALHHAQVCGFATSVSCEPLLEPERAADLVRAVDDDVTGTIWIGKANRLRLRTAWAFSPEATETRLRTLNAQIERIEAEQTDAKVREIYETLKGNPKVRWKDSYRSVLGLGEECG